MKDFNSLLSDLENEATKTWLKDKMSPFPGGVITCPWLNWWKCQPDASADKIRGIFIMQDWWNCSKGLQEDVDYIGKQDFSYKEDRTIHNLYKAKAWKEAIWNDKTWLVTNAVWGLRMQINGKNQPPVRDLSAIIHKAAFPIWSQIIKHFAKRHDFKVMFAGAWSASRNERKVWEGKALSDFLESWKVWAGKGIGKNDEVSKLDFTDVNGNAYFCCHPSVWNIRFNCLDGPPPNRV
jgi:hypothetical protein